MPSSVSSVCSLTAAEENTTYRSAPAYPGRLMDIVSENSEKVGFWSRCLSSLSKKTADIIVGISDKVKKAGKDDPRRIAHAFKVGLALTLVSVFYYVTPLFQGFGDSTMWAVLTVVVVMEYTVGATLSKGLNRAFATLLAGALGVGAHQIAVLCGEKGEPILLGVFVFLLAAAATFSRFIPEIKARYDYGVTIFILTFSLVAVSSYRVEDLMRMAHQRLATVAVGVATCLFTSVFVFPIWAGEDLRLLVAGNLDKLAAFLEGLESECFGEKGGAESNVEGKPFVHAYKGVLNSKPTEDTLYNFARWEPCQAPFSYLHRPWKQYLKIGAYCRRCASSMEALTAYVISTSSKIKSSTDPELCLRIRTACKEMSSESAKALRELSATVRTMAVPSSAGFHVSAAVSASEELRAALAEDVALSEVLHVATAASLLADLVLRIQEIAGLVKELARLVRFKNHEAAHKGSVYASMSPSPAHVVINVKY